MLTKHWREIFEPQGQIFLNSVVARSRGAETCNGGAEH